MSDGTGIEALDRLPHRIYDRLIRGGVGWVETLVNLSDDVLLDKFEFTRNEINEIRSALDGYTPEETRARAQQIIASAEVRQAVEELTDWRDLVRASVKAYERKFGVGPHAR